MIKPILAVQYAVKNLSDEEKKVFFSKGRSIMGIGLSMVRPRLIFQMGGLETLPHKFSQD